MAEVMKTSWYSLFFLCQINMDLIFKEKCFFTGSRNEIRNLAAKKVFK
jgi:hypothetical protein